MDPKKRKRRRFLILALLVVGVIAATGAYAYWTSGGSGAGGATTGTTTNLTVNQVGTPSGLYPGGPPQPLSGNFDNPNAGSVTVSSVTGTVTGTGNAGCAAANYAITGTSVIAGGGVVPSGAGVGGWSGLSIQMLNTSSNQDACKNATVIIAYTAA